MGAEPEFGRSVFDAGGAEGYVCDEVIGILWVDKGIVFVDCLAHSSCIGEGGIGCQPIPDWFVAKISGLRQLRTVFRMHAVRYTYAFANWRTNGL